MGHWKVEVRLGEGVNQSTVNCKRHRSKENEWREKWVNISTRIPSLPYILKYTTFSLEVTDIL